jgi:hypothetical protein
LQKRGDAALLAHGAIRWIVGELAPHWEDRLQLQELDDLRPPLRDGQSY